MNPIFTSSAFVLVPANSKDLLPSVPLDFVQLLFGVELEAYVSLLEVFH